MDAMRLDVPLELYRIFCVVVRTGNMSLAAKELFITQPAVSMSVRSLEDKMGKTLLVRGPKGIRPTAEGEMLYEGLRQALELIGATERNYLAMVSLEAGELRIGAGDTLIGRFLLGYIGRFIAAYPKINIKLVTGGDTLRQLGAGGLDLAFVDLPADENGIEFRPVLTVHDCLIGGAKYAGLRETGVDLDGLGAYALILPGRGAGARKFIDQYAAAYGVTLEPIIEMDNLPLECARDGLGLAFAARELISRELCGGDVFEIPLRPAPPGRLVAAARPKALSCAARRFMELFE